MIIVAVSISPEKVSELIGLIYDCALDPARWPLALDAFRSALDFANAVLALQELPSGRQLLNATAGIDPHWLSRVAAYDLDVMMLWGGPERILQYPLDEPIIYSRVEGLPPLHHSRYYSEWLQPQGIDDAAVIGFAREPAMIGSITFGRHTTAGPTSDHEITILRLIAPHFRRAAAISKLLDLKTISARTFEATLDSLSAGVVLVDEQLGVVHANAAADAMLRSADPITAHGGRLATLASVSTNSLHGAVTQAARERHRLGHRGIGIPLRRKDGSPCVIHVLPMGDGDVRPGLRRRAQAALFIASASTPPQMPRAALTLFYDLTNAEAQVFELIVDGKTQSQIAHALGVAPSTVKTHLRHVFDKTGCNRQADLIKLAASLVVPV